MRITPLDVHEQSFRVSFRGFDPAEVDAFLQRVADEMERLIEERDRLQAEVDSAGQARRNLEEALASAGSLQEGMLAKARAEAEILEHQAQLRADRILAEANEELVRLRREVREVRERRSLWLGEVSAAARTLAEWAERRAADEAETPPLIENEVAEREEEPGAAPHEDEDAG